MKARRMVLIVLILAAGCAREAPSAPPPAPGFPGVILVAKGGRIVHADVRGPAEPGGGCAFDLASAAFCRMNG